jgi:hypothetical protein
MARLKPPGGTQRETLTIFALGFLGARNIPHLGYSSIFPHIVGDIFENIPESERD